MVGLLTCIQVQTPPPLSKNRKDFFQQLAVSCSHLTIRNYFIFLQNVRREAAGWGGGGSGGSGGSIEPPRLKQQTSKTLKLSKL